MPKRKPTAAFFDRAVERGSELDREGIDSTVVHKLIASSTNKKYRYALSLWQG
jgi:hypothetical protein